MKVQIEIPTDLNKAEEFLFKNLDLIRPELLQTAFYLKELDNIANELEEKES